MYTKALRTTWLNTYGCVKSQLATFLRFQYPLEYNQPRIRKQFPGPKHQEALENIQAYNLDAQYQVQRFIDFKKSKGNYFADVDGNIVLDLHQNYANLALGYNHDVFVNARHTELYDRFVANRVDASVLPTEDYADLLRDNVMPIAPAGMTQVHLNDGTTTQANESALTIALLKYAQEHGKTAQDAQNLCVLGFQNGYHGNSIATLSCSDAEVNLQQVPTFDWPVAPFPKMKYPMSQYEHENIAEEDRCLQEARRIIKERRDQKKDVGAMIVEPISAYNNEMATPRFYKELRKIATEFHIPFIVDETKTGVGSTGKMWGHEHWYLSQPADIVTFGGKSGISGFYSTVDFRLSDQEGALSFEQNVDMVKLLNFGLTWRYIQKKNLLSYVNDTSTFLKIELARVNNEKGICENIRGYGTFLGFDVPQGHSETVQKYLFRSGIHLLRCGPRTFGLRPALILGPKQAAYLRDNLMYYSPNIPKN